ncbi:hypothetical protein T492DRAFT_1135378 [Pavlovales sp. CCMP2436]|nr:hypothetical protein T492DRAFT_1135378 [Pavlovales sp. CCMP2436]
MARMRVLAARSAVALGALGVACQLSADAKFKCALAMAAVSDSKGPAGAAEVLGLLASAARNGPGAVAGAGAGAGGRQPTFLAQQRQRLAIEPPPHLSSSPKRSDVTSEPDLSGRFLALLGKRSDVTSEPDHSGRFLALLGMVARVEGVCACLLEGGALETAAILLDANVAGTPSPKVGCCAPPTPSHTHTHPPPPPPHPTPTYPVKDWRVARRAPSRRVYAHFLVQSSLMPQGLKRTQANRLLEFATSLLALTHHSRLTKPHVYVSLVPLPRFEELSNETEDTSMGPLAQPKTAAEAEAGAEPTFDVVGPALKLLTTLVHADASLASTLCGRGSIPALVKLLCHASDHVRGNAALCVSELARDERSLAVLAVQPHLIEPLLDIAHHKTGALQKNAAICLARLAKNAHCLQAIRDGHGMEILMQYVKPKI